MKFAADKTRAEPAPRALQEAAEWFACLSDPAAVGAVREADRERWRAWLRAHPDHALAWQRVELVTQRLAPLAGAGRLARQALESRRSGRRRTLKTLALFATAGGAALALSRLPWREWEHAYAQDRAAYRTALGERRALVLADGGRAWLGSASALDAAYSQDLRRLRLYAGELLVETAPDSREPPRPFVVDTLHGRLRALGTRFAVRTESASTRVDLLEGALEIVLDGDRSSPHPVRAGEHAVFDRRRVLARGPASPGRAAWARGLLVADGMRLDELLGELGRWHALAIECDAGVAALRVVGTYPLDHPERVLAALEASLPVRVLRRGDRLRLVPRAEAAIAPPRLAPARQAE
jgi:transmembrane sensor